MLRYCSQCGNALTEKEVGDEGLQKFCPICGRFYFKNPACCVLTAIVNEKNQVLLLKQNYISRNNYTLCSGYLKKDETLEEAVKREVFEETGQRVRSLEYVASYPFAPKNLIMVGFIAFVTACEFGASTEVDELIWADWERAKKLVERENNLSGTHLDRCAAWLREFGKRENKHRDTHGS